jgi:alpha-amylase/alpha-mannosidase (GH57 family)
MSQTRSIVLHGHFYQPPREDPWTDQVPAQPTAAPYHDWNERIERECYGPIVASRVLADGDGPELVVNALEWMSFDFGPTLLVWLERHAPDTYAAILEADRRSVARLGHGNALAMPYHHPILPLATPRDRAAEVRWGIADFRRRFGREPEGMWLPETAVDDATLDTLAAEGIRFTVVAPHQVDPAPTDGRPVRHVTASGRDIALFVYDGALSHGVAFGELLSDGVAWAERMMAEDESVTLSSIATDGETFGHHHVFAEMALAKAIVELRDRSDARFESFASFLAREGAHHGARLVAPSAWSCAHGVDRWRLDCGCRADPSAEMSQAWRAPLRGALEWLARGLHDV